MVSQFFITQSIFLVNFVLNQFLYLLERIKICNSSIYFYFKVRQQLKALTKQYDMTENYLKALQSVGQIVGEVLKQLTEEKCK